MVSRKVICPECEELIGWRGLSMHLRLKHNMTLAEARAASKDLEPEEEEDDDEQPSQDVVELVKDLHARLSRSDDSDDDDDDEEGPLTLSTVIVVSLRRLKALASKRELIQWAAQVGYLTEGMHDRIDTEIDEEFGDVLSGLRELQDAYDEDLDTEDEILVEDDSWVKWFEDEVSPRRRSGEGDRFFEGWGD